MPSNQHEEGEDIQVMSKTPVFPVRNFELTRFIVDFSHELEVFYFGYSISWNLKAYMPGKKWTLARPLIRYSWSTNG